MEPATAVEGKPLPPNANKKTSGEVAPYGLSGSAPRLMKPRESCILLKPAGWPAGLNILMAPKGVNPEFLTFERSNLESNLLNWMTLQKYVRIAGYRPDIVAALGWQPGSPFV
jgi:hypothetical protein